MTKAIPEEAKNFRLLGHDPSAAWGGGSKVEVINGTAFVGAVGGSSYDGKEGVTIHDVSDPRKPRKIAEIPAPPGVHTHKVRLVGEDLLYVNSERLPGERGKGARPGFSIYDIKKPTEPKLVEFYDLPGGGPHRFGVDNQRQLAFFPNDAPGWKERVIWTMDIRDPLKPEVVGIGGLPWQKEDAGALGNNPMPGALTCTLHGPPVIRGDRMFAGFWGGGMAIFDCSDLANLKLVGNICWSPPFAGSTHTVWPIGDRPYLVVTDEAHGKQNYWESQFMWIVDIREETNPIPVATYMPDREKYFERGGRFGAHNILEYIPSEGAWANLVFLTYFNAGLRVIDTTDPFHPKEIGSYVPATGEGQPAVQSNDVGSDEHGRLYLIDRWGAGMHILEYTG